MPQRRSLRLSKYHFSNGLAIHFGPRAAQRAYPGHGPNYKRAGARQNHLPGNSASDYLFPMRKTRVAAITALVLAALGAVFWILFGQGEREPVYQGKTLTCWMSDFLPDRDATPEELEQDTFAVRQIGTNAIPILLKWISRDGRLKQKMVTWIYDHPRAPFRIKSSVDKNMLAASGFGILGKSQAGSAVPALIEIVRTGGGEKISGDDIVTFAMLALADIDPQAATNAGIMFGTNQWSGTNITVIGWSAPAAEVK